MSGDIQGLREQILSNARAVFAPRFESHRPRCDPAKLDIVIVRNKQTGGDFAIVTYDYTENVAEGGEAATIQGALESLLGRLVEATEDNNDVELMYSEDDWVHEDFGLA